MSVIYLIIELHVRKDRMRVLRHHIWNRPHRRQQQPVERSAGNVAKFGKVAYRYGLLVVVEKGILTIHRKTQKFINLITCSDHKTLEIQWIIGELVVGHEPLEHSERRDWSFRNVVMAKQIKPDLSRLAVVQDRFAGVGRRPITVENAIAGLR